MTREITRLNYGFIKTIYDAIGIAIEFDRKNNLVVTMSISIDFLNESDAKKAADLVKKTSKIVYVEEDTSCSIRLFQYFSPSSVEDSIKLYAAFRDEVEDLISTFDKVDILRVERIVD